MVKKGVERSLSFSPVVGESGNKKALWRGQKGDTSETGPPGRQDLLIPAAIRYLMRLHTLI